MLLGREWCMKKLGNVNSVFDLLDREKKWKWGYQHRSFDYRVQQYLDAITELGRPLIRADTKGKWNSAYHFIMNARQGINKGFYSTEETSRLIALPYFCLDWNYEEQRRLVDRVVAFKIKHGRRPSRYIVTDHSVIYSFTTLQRAFHKGRLYPDLRTRLDQEGLLTSQRELDNEARMVDLEIFVHNNKRWPMHIRRVLPEYNLYNRYRQMRNTLKEGKASEEHQRRFEALEREVQSYNENSKRNCVRLAG